MCNCVCPRLAFSLTNFNPFLVEPLDAAITLARHPAVGNLLSWNMLHLLYITTGLVLIHLYHVDPLPHHHLAVRPTATLGVIESLSASLKYCNNNLINVGIGEYCCGVISGKFCSNTVMKSSHLVPQHVIHICTTLLSYYKTFLIN